MNLLIAILVVIISIILGAGGEATGWIEQPVYFWLLGAVTGALTIMIATHD